LKPLLFLATAKNHGALSISLVLASGETPPLVSAIRHLAALSRQFIRKPVPGVHYT
jgi:hypothetical protein